MGREPMTADGADAVPWSELRNVLDDADESPWPSWLPPRGPGLVTALGHRPVTADHLGPTPCMSLKVGDIVNVSITPDFEHITYGRIRDIRSFPDERVISLEYGDAEQDGWPAEIRVPMMRLFTSVYRPIR